MQAAHFFGAVHRKQGKGRNWDRSNGPRGPPIQIGLNGQISRAARKLLGKDTPERGDRQRTMSVDGFVGKDCGMDIGVQSALYAAQQEHRQ